MWQVLLIFMTNYKSAEFTFHQTPMKTIIFWFTTYKYISICNKYEN